MLAHGAPLKPFATPSFGDCWDAGYLHVSICRVFIGPRSIGWVASKLVDNWTPIRIEPTV